MFTLSRTTPPTPAHAHWGGVFAMTLCVFVLIASEFMPVSLLTPIARDLNVTEGLAGQGIAISGALAVLTSLTISNLAGSLNRKYLLLGLTVLMAASGLIVALASSYAVYMAGRALIGIVIGGFWSMSAATAIRLVPQRQVPRALAIFNGGNALATVVAAPLGSYLGSTVGWRGAFLCLAPLAIAAFVWQCVSLPAMESDNASRPRGSALRLFRTPIVAIGPAGLRTLLHGAVYPIYLRAAVSGNGNRPQRLWPVPDFARDRHRGFYRHPGRFATPHRPVLSDLNLSPLTDGRDCRNVAAGRTPRLGRSHSVKLVGNAGDGGANRLVDVDSADAARRRGSRWRTDGRRDSAVDCAGFDGRRRGI